MFNPDSLAHVYIMANECLTRVGAGGPPVFLHVSLVHPGTELHERWHGFQFFADAHHCIAFW